MAGFLYYIPKVNNNEVTDQLIKAKELDYALGSNRSVRGLMKGPDGVEGVVIGNKRSIAAEKVGYFPDKQSWRQIPKSDCWVGMYNDDRPTPEDLVVPAPLGGHKVKLADDQMYTIPVALMYSEEFRGPSPALPHSVDVTDDGDWTLGKVFGTYANLEELANQFWNAFAMGIQSDEGSEDGQSGQVKFDFAGVSDGALAALSTNYAVNKAEIVLAGLFGGSVQQEILQALIDWPSVQEFIKKKAAESQALVTSDSEPGPPG
ncbi:MAG: hypothetical protein ACPGXK_00230 [Phycisphaerae bacterium]